MSESLKVQQRRCLTRTSGPDAQVLAGERAQVAPHRVQPLAQRQHLLRRTRRVAGIAVDIHPGLQGSWVRQGATLAACAHREAMAVLASANMLAAHD